MIIYGENHLRPFTLKADLLLVGLCTLFILLLSFPEQEYIP